jgi:1-pyrroline-5-carboxylate dehydrogenase
MNNGYFDFHEPKNESVLAYAPHSAERKALQKAVAAMKAEVRDIPMYIGGEEVRSGDKKEIRPPHETSHLLGYFHASNEQHVHDAIDAALSARATWAAMSWEHRAAIFLKAADLLATKYRFRMNAATMLGQSKNAYQAEIDSACELIDFLRFNVHFLSQIYKQQPLSPVGMNNRMEYRPLEGFVLAVTPFNFTAIGGNLPTSAAMCGNVVVWKPANTQVYSASVFYGNTDRGWPASWCHQPHLPSGRNGRRDILCASIICGHTLYGIDRRIPDHVEEHWRKHSTL